MIQYLARRNKVLKKGYERHLWTCIRKVFSNKNVKFLFKFLRCNIMLVVYHSQNRTSFYACYLNQAIQTNQGRDKGKEVLLNRKLKETKLVQEI